MGFYEDWWGPSSYWATTQPGTSQPWAGGQLTMGEGGQATYYDPSGSNMQFTQNTPLADIYANPNIANQWNTQYGKTMMGNVLGAPDSPVFDIPTNLYPSSTNIGITTNTGQSTSQSGSSSYGQSGSLGFDKSLSQAMSDAFSRSMGQSMSDSLSRSMGRSQSTNQSQSGINWGTPFMQAIAPELISSAQALQPNVENMAKTLQDQYGALMRQGLGPQAFQGTLNEMAGRGMLGSTETSAALQNTAKDVMTNIGNQAFNAMLGQQQAQMQVPQILGSLAQLGQEASSLGQSTSMQDAMSQAMSRAMNESTSGSTSRQQSEATSTNVANAINQAQSFMDSLSQTGGGSINYGYSSDPLDPYRLMTQLLTY